MKTSDYGNLYVLKIEGSIYKNLHKIGITKRPIEKRLYELSRNVPFLKYSVCHCWQFEGYNIVEKIAHYELNEFKTEDKGDEYFDVELYIIRETINYLIEEFITKKEPILTYEEIINLKERYDLFHAFCPNLDKESRMAFLEKYPRKEIKQNEFISNLSKLRKITTTSKKYDIEKYQESRPKIQPNFVW